MICNICGEELPYIHSDIENPYKRYKGKDVCLECWCDKFGELIEEYPIGYVPSKQRNRYRHKIDVPLRK